VPTPPLPALPPEPVVAPLPAFPPVALVPPVSPPLEPPAALRVVVAESLEEQLTAQTTLTIRDPPSHCIFRIAHSVGSSVSSQSERFALADSRKIRWCRIEVEKRVGAGSSVRAPECSSRAPEKWLMVDLSAIPRRAFIKNRSGGARSRTCAAGAGRRSLWPCLHTPAASQSSRRRASFP